MSNRFTRTEWLLGTDAMGKLEKSKVIIFGVGGVGTYVAEGLARCNIGKFVLVDDDVICESNINRQIHATTSTIGQYKVEAMAKRMKEINPNVQIEERKTFVLTENIKELLTSDISYAVDALDTVTAKISIAMYCKEKGIPLISSMGTGNKLNPTLLQISDIYSTSICPLCKVMRKELRKRGIESLKVVFSNEEPITPKNQEQSEDTAALHRKRAVPGSVSFVPSVAGLIIASEVVKDLTS